MASAGRHPAEAHGQPTAKLAAVMPLLIDVSNLNAKNDRPHIVCPN
jgi:hypothetical protein